jgi:phage FluMu gp28-like protein
MPHLLIHSFKDYLVQHQNQWIEDDQRGLTNENIVLYLKTSTCKIQAAPTIKGYSLQFISVHNPVDHLWDGDRLLQFPYLGKKSFSSFNLQKCACVYGINEIID